MAQERAEAERGQRREDEREGRVGRTLVGERERYREHARDREVRDRIGAERVLRAVASPDSRGRDGDDGEVDRGVA